MTFWNASSGCPSNSAPHVAPALANRMSTLSVCFSTSLTSLSTSPGFARSAGTEMALQLTGSLFKAAHASSQALTLRDVMKILEQPAWASLGTAASRIAIGMEEGGGSYPDAACRPSPREPPVTTATLPLREKREEKSLSLTSASADMICAVLRERKRNGAPGYITERPAEDVYQKPVADKLYSTLHTVYHLDGLEHRSRGGDDGKRSECLGCMGGGF